MDLGSACHGGCDFPGLAFPPCRKPCEWGAGHLGRCACVMHALDPFAATFFAADRPDLLSGRVRPGAPLPAHRAAAAASAPVPLVVALHQRGLADKAPALRKAGFVTFRSLLDADPVHLAPFGISHAELGEQESSSSLALC